LKNPLVAADQIIGKQWDVGNRKIQRYVSDDQHPTVVHYKMVGSGGDF
jgi:hypothetical protein